MLKTLRNTARLSVYLFAALLLIAGCSSSNPCENVTCQNGGNCVDGTCNCVNGYTGANCQTASNNPCLNVTCQNGGNCVDGTCNCVNGYTGANCETAPNYKYCRIPELKINSFTLAQGRSVANIYPELKSAKSAFSNNSYSWIQKLQPNQVPANCPLTFLEASEPWSVWSSNKPGTVAPDLYNLWSDDVQVKIYDKIDANNIKLLHTYILNLNVARQNGFPETITLGNGAVTLKMLWKN